MIDLGEGSTPEITSVSIITFTQVNLSISLIIFLIFRIFRQTKMITTKWFKHPIET